MGHTTSLEPPAANQDAVWLWGALGALPLPFLYLISCRAGEMVHVLDALDFLGVPSIRFYSKPFNNKKKKIQIQKMLNYNR